MKRRWSALLAGALLAALMLGGCAQDGASAAEVEARLLEDISARVGPGEAELVSLHYGSFSDENTREVAAVFRTVEDEAPSGTVGMPLCVYDADSLEPVAYLPTLSGDRGSSTAFYFLPTQGGRTYILALAGGAAQGTLFTWSHLLTLEDGAWVEHSIPGVDGDGGELFLATAHMGEPLMLTVLEQDGQFRGLHQYPELFGSVSTSLLWSAEEGAFVPLDENWMFVS